MSAKSLTSNELRDPPRMSFTARVVSADARELIKRLHGQVLAQYATMPKRSYNRQAARGKLPRLIGAMVGELLHVRTTNQSLGWMSLNLRDDYIRTFGYGWQSFSNLLPSKVRALSSACAATILHWDSQCRALEEMRAFAH
jgi:hypothetical protein